RVDAMVPPLAVWEESPAIFGQRGSEVHTAIKLDTDKCHAAMQDATTPRVVAFRLEESACLHFAVAANLLRQFVEPDFPFRHGDGIGAAMIGIASGYRLDLVIAGAKALLI